MATGWIIPVVVLFHTLFAAVHGALSRTQASLRVTARAGAEVFNPPSMLLMSSPMERKVSYTQIVNFQSVGGVVLPLLDAGLVGPYGIAWDGPRGALYVCDGALRQIFRVQLQAFKCTRQCKGIDYQLKTVGNRYVVVEGVIAQWASVDAEGNLFFTDQEKNSVDKLPVEAIDMIIRDQLLPKNLGRTTEPESEGEEAVKEAEEPMAGENTTVTHVTTPQPPSIFSSMRPKSALRLARLLAFTQTDLGSIGLISKVGSAPDQLPKGRRNQRSKSQQKVMPSRPSPVSSLLTTLGQLTASR